MAAAKESLDHKLLDINHVGNKFPSVHKTPWLEERLGKAMTQRREYLKYCREHHGRLARDIKHYEGNQNSLQEAPSRMLITQMQQRNKQWKKGLEIQAPSPLDSIVASTLDATLLDKTDVLSDENVSQTSFATSLGEDSGSYRRRIPPIPEEAARGMPFQCPYCWGIQIVKDEHSWRLAILYFLKS